MLQFDSAADRVAKYADSRIFGGGWEFRCIVGVLRAVRLRGDSRTPIEVELDERHPFKVFT